MLIPGEHGIAGCVADIEFTDMPDGEWKFFITNDGSGECTLILMSEY